MEDFLRRHRALLVSLAFMLTGAHAAGYALFYQPYSTALAALNRETANMNRALAEQRQMRAALAEAARTDAAAVLDEAVERIRSIPDFLEHINETARRVNRDNDLPKVVLRQLIPERDESLKYGIEIVVDYATFLKFTAQLELRDMVINDMQVRPYDLLAQPPEHLVRFTITPRNDLKELPPGRLRDRAAQMLAEAGQPNQRNPFQQLVGNLSTPLIPLTNKHRLTFIGRSDDRLFASIDRRTYYIGEALHEAGSPGSKVLTEINEEERRVYLEEETDAGTFRFVIGFPDADRP